MQAMASHSAPHREVKLCQQTGEIQVKSLPYTGPGPWGLTEAGVDISWLEELCSTSQNVPEKLWRSPSISTGRWTRHIVLKDWLAGHSRKSLRQFLSLPARHPLFPPSLPWLCILSASDKEQIYLSIGSLLNIAKGKRLCVDWGPGQGFWVCHHRNHLWGKKAHLVCHTS